MTDKVQFSTIFEYKHDGNWINISDDVFVHSVQIRRGISGSGFTSRVAGPGELTFQVRNDAGNSGGVEGYYTSSHTNCRTGWGKDIEIRVRFVADGLSYVKFKGYISKLESIGDLHGGTLAVTAEDLLGELRNKMKLPALARNKTMSEGAEIVLDNLNVVPEGGLEVQGTMSQSFATIFDISRKDSAALTEFAKLARSNMGYIMLVGDRETGEKLLFQSRDARSAASVAQVPVGNANGARLVDYDDNPLVDYDGNPLVETAVQNVDITDKNKRISDDENVINKARVKVFPRRENQSLQVLFKLDNKPLLEPGESMTIIGAYTDPTAEAMEVAAYSMQSPVSGTDYAANTAEDGSGDDRTSDLAVSAPEYGVKEVENTFQNNHETDSVYVTIQNRGYGVYFFRAVEVVAEDITDKVYETAITLDYVDNVAAAQEIANDIVDALKTPRLEVPFLEFDLENSWANYWGAIWLESGMKIPIVDERYELDGYAFVQEYTLRENNGGWTCSFVLASEAVSTI